MGAGGEVGYETLLSGLKCSLLCSALCCCADHTWPSQVSPAAPSSRQVSSHLWPLGTTGATLLHSDINRSGHGLPFPLHWEVSLTSCHPLRLGDTIQPVPHPQWSDLDWGGGSLLEGIEIGITSVGYLQLLPAASTSTRAQSCSPVLSILPVTCWQ